MTIQLDHYAGRAVESVEDAPASSEGVWQIILTGDVKIINYDPEIPAPENLVGKDLGVVIMDSDWTTIRFMITDAQGNVTESEEVKLNPMEYGIEDSEREPGIVTPQVGGYDPADDLPDEPVERLQEEAQPPEEAPVSDSQPLEAPGEAQTQEQADEG